MITFLLVGGGGVLGSLARYGLTKAIQRSLDEPSFFLGSSAVNLIGCLLIGLVLGLLEHRAEDTSYLRAFVAIGILGGFTTFSAFGYDTLHLLRDDRTLAAICNLLLQPALGFLLAWAGWSAAKAV